MIVRKGLVRLCMASSLRRAGKPLYPRPLPEGEGEGTASSIHHMHCNGVLALDAHQRGVVIGDNPAGLDMGLHPQGGGLGLMGGAVGLLCHGSTPSLLLVVVSGCLAVLLEKMEKIWRFVPAAGKKMTSKTLLFRERTTRRLFCTGVPRELSIAYVLVN